MKALLSILAALFLTETVFGQAGPDAKLNLVLAQPETNIQVGDEFEIPLMVSAATEPQRYVVADIVFAWNP